jgi:hypothetical protein
MSKRIVTAVALVLGTAPAWAQVPAGGDIVANTYTTGEQQRTRVAVEPDGDFVVVWQSNLQDGSGYGVFAQRYDSAGAPRGAEFQVNTFTTGIQYRPAVASDTKGNFVVAWQSANQDGAANGIFAQRYDPNGNRRGGEFLVNTTTIGSQYRVSMAAAPNGNVMIAWTDNAGAQPNIGVTAQIFDSGGNRVGGELMVNTYTTGNQYGQAVAADGLGNFIVAWNDTVQDGNGRGVFAQRFTNTGAPIGVEFRVNSYTTGQQYLWHSGVAAAADGRFVIAFGGYFDGGGAGVHAQRFDATGAAVGNEFVVNTYTTGTQRLAAAAMDEQGNFVVAYEDTAAHDGSLYGIFAQRLNAAGVARGAEFQVNVFTTNLQSRASAASDPVGNFVVVWRSVTQDGSLSAAVARRYGWLRPTALNLNTTGNLVWEPGESVDMRPTWRNTNGAAQTFAATLTNLTGPAGATYTLTDGTGDYGTVANNTSAPCTDCYTVAVNNPATRPVQHWDATALESITPDAQGQQKRWRLHIGASFADVPTSNAFYRFIETLLHHGVTGGCTATNYCPANSTTRAQMAVFVLLAKEAQGYVPPACTTPIFNDVPASSPFCRFIEELFRRGVIGGCAPNMYCPDDPVTREQMPVFVLRTLDPTFTPPPCSAPNIFNDVPETNPFCPWIEELSRRGVVTGCGGGNYCPSQPVTREQMGVFISVTFGLTLYGP